MKKMMVLQSMDDPMGTSTYAVPGSKYDYISVEAAMAEGWDLVSVTVSRDALPRYSFFFVGDFQ